MSLRPARSPYDSSVALPPNLARTQVRPPARLYNREQHLLVVPPDRNERASFAEGDEVVRRRPAVRAPVDVVAQGDDGVVGARLDSVDQGFQGPGAAVDVTDGDFSGHVTLSIFAVHDLISFSKKTSSTTASAQAKNSEGECRGNGHSPETVISPEKQRCSAAVVRLVAFQGFESFQGCLPMVAEALGGMQQPSR